MEKPASALGITELVELEGDGFFLFLAESHD